VAFVLTTLVCLVALELGARGFWRLGYHLSFRHPNRVLDAFYPELRSVDEVQPRRGDGYYNVLMLGGSGLHHAWSQAEPALLEQLYLTGRKNARIFNFSAPAHTSRDSLLKYAALDDARFDLVLVYDGANEARTNNVPPEMFREDYSHYSWYATINAVAPYHRTAVFALPYTLRYALANAKQRLAPGRYVPTHEPRPDWVEYGRTPRSVAPFERNLAAIVAIAAQRGDPLMLMTVAAYVPANYSRQAFSEKRLDYLLHRMPVESLGQREYVMATVTTHNDVVRRLAAAHQDVLFVDQQAAMEGSSRNFDDPFHMTIAGSVTFAEHIVAVLRPHVEQQ
jgi:lysophospholipase L1-like esterase